MGRGRVVVVIIVALAAGSACGGATGHDDVREFDIAKVNRCLENSGLNTRTVSPPNEPPVLELYSGDGDMVLDMLFARSREEAQAMFEGESAEEGLKLRGNVVYRWVRHSDRVSAQVNECLTDAQVRGA